MTTGRTVYLDTNIIIYALEDAEGIGASLRRLAGIERLNVVNPADPA